MSNPIGVFGGIFDPVHNGHLAAARLAYDHFTLEKPIFIPAGIPPHKTTTLSVSPAHRLEMLRIALNDESYAVIWEQEVRRPGVSYTVDTLRELTRLHPGSSIYFLVGADNLPEIPTWHCYREILEMVTLCVTERPGYSMEIPALLTGAHLLTFPSPQWGISSTLLRSYLAQGYHCKHLLPNEVYEYILKHRLYRQYEDTVSVVKYKQAH
jgi:nicotinate-nucleotide adenylyltransferase